MSPGARVEVSLPVATLSTAAARGRCDTAQLLHSRSKLMPPSHNLTRDHPLPTLANEPVPVFILLPSHLPSPLPCSPDRLTQIRISNAGYAFLHLLGFDRRKWCRLQYPPRDCVGGGGSGGLFRFRPTPA